MGQVTRRRLMDRKIIEMLREGAAVKLIVRSLHVSKKRVKELRRLAWKYDYLGRGGGLPDPDDSHPNGGEVLDGGAQRGVLLWRQ